MHGGDEKFIQILVGKHVRKRTLGRTKRMCEDKIKMDFKKWRVDV
jgi:hypothetical protein